MRMPSGVAVVIGMSMTFLFVALGIVVQNATGAISFEGMAFLVNYLSSPARSLPEIVFDPIMNDWGLYQARELSYLFDYMNAQFILLSAKAGAAHLLSLSHYLCIAGIVAAIHCVWRRVFGGLDYFLLTLCGLILVCSPFVFFEGMFFRSSKSFCAFALAVICPALLALCKSRVAASPWRKTFLVLLISVGALLMCLMDRQGCFFTFLLCVGCGLSAMALSLATRVSQEAEAVAEDIGKTLLGLSLSLLGILVFAALYNRVLAPLAIFHFNGYSPDFSFQRMDIGAIFNFKGGLQFLFGGMGVIACESGIAGGLALSALIGMGLLSPILAEGGLWREFVVRRPQTLLPALAYAFALSGMMVSGNMMVAKHPAILWPDVIRGMYFLPSAVIVAFFMAWALQLTLKSFPFDGRRKLLLSALLVFLLLGDVLSIPRDIEIKRNGTLAVETSYMPEVLFLIRNPSRAFHISFLSYLHLDLIKVLRER
jgi:hypothetical protein